MQVFLYNGCKMEVVVVVVVVVVEEEMDYLSTLCLKKDVPPLTFYNLYIHGSIAAIFGKNVAKKVGNQNILYFSTLRN